MILSADYIAEHTPELNTRLDKSEFIRRTKQMIAIESPELTPVLDSLRSLHPRWIGPITLATTISLKLTVAEDIGKMISEVECGKPINKTPMCITSENVLATITMFSGTDENVVDIAKKHTGNAMWEAIQLWAALTREEFNKFIRGENIPSIPVGTLDLMIVYHLYRSKVREITSR